METLHRPWPMPDAPWMLRMEWRDLLFMHWPVPVAALRSTIPAALSIDTFDGTGWIGVVPFRMAGVRPRAVPAVPWLSDFPELNLRTYVTIDGKPGVWFWSLDCTNPVAVRLARLGFSLPYFDARMQVATAGMTTRYHSERTHRNAAPAVFDATYQPTGPATIPQPATIEDFLTARYCLYSADRRGRVWRGDIHHQPWPLQPAVCEIRRNTMTEQIGLRLPDMPPLLHFARFLDVVAWLPERVS